MDEPTNVIHVKPYIKTEWEDHIVDPIDGEILQQGTPVSARNLNKMEQGIYDALNSFLLFAQEYGWPPTKIDCPIEHNLNAYPAAIVLEITGGYGMLGYGEGFYGGGASNEVKSNVVYDSRNKLHLSICKKITGEPAIGRIGQTEFIIKFSDTVLLVILGGCQVTTTEKVTSGVTSFNGRDGDVVLTEADIPETVTRNNQLVNIPVDDGEI